MIYAMFFDFLIAASGKVQIQLYNMMGSNFKDLFSQNLKLVDQYQLTFDVSELPIVTWLLLVGFSF